MLMYGLMHLGSQEKDKKLFLEMRGKQEGEEGEEEVLEEKEFLALMGFVIFFCLVFLFIIFTCDQFC